MARMLSRLLFCIGAFFIGLVIFLLYDFHLFIHTPLLSQDIAGHQQSIVFQLQPNTSLKKLVHELAELNVLPTAKEQHYFEWLVQLHQASGMLKAGEYELLSTHTPEDLLQKLINAQVVLYGFTIVEGWSFEEVLQALEKHPKLQKKLTGLSASEIAQKLQLPAQPEGWFYPATYYFSLGFSDEAVLKKAYQHMQKTIEEEWKNRSPNILLTTAYEGLILASIIEKETALQEERQLMSGVYQLRLKNKMLLQADPTVLYGLPERKKALSKADLQSDTPYNTYKYPGLPPTPIAAPSLSSIRAAFQPDIQGYLYFVATGKGGHYFSKDLTEHNQAVKQYRLKTD